MQIGAISPDAGRDKGFIADFIYHTGLPVSSRGGGADEGRKVRMAICKELRKRRRVVFHFSAIMQF